MDALASQLAAVGITALPAADCGAERAHLVVFDRSTSELCGIVRELRAHGVRQVVGVATTAQALAGGTSWDLLAAGATDVHLWDGGDFPALELVARLERWRRIDELMSSPVVDRCLAGHSRRWDTVVRQVVEVAYFTDASVLITGETGTGKELVAGLVHALDARPDKGRFVVVDCTTIVPSLSGSEFFGHERGSFTGAVTSRDGAFALADGGTLFLDEVGELPPTLQAELLRVVQEGSYKRVGSNEWRTTRFRLVCATHRDLLDGGPEFRRDFYYRIAGWSCHLPTLGERMEDILPLALSFLAQLRPGQQVPAFDPAVRELLLRRTYPGNVRDLRQLVTRLHVRHVGPGPITVGDLPEGEWLAGADARAGWRDERFDQCIRRALASGAGVREISRDAADVATEIALEEAGGNLRQASVRLGVTPRALQLRSAKRRRHADDDDAPRGHPNGSP
jgi:transcriptional regulator with GAF, ATPase, and Fis domain